MDAKQKKVLIKLQTIIKDNGQVEHNEQQHIGSYQNKRGLDVLIFEEKLEDGSIVKNMITMQDDKVSINRSGAVKMNQKFRNNGLTENTYQHPYGVLTMETFTESIAYQRLSKNVKGELTIHYTVSLNGQGERQHILKLDFKEEENQ